MAREFPGDDTPSLDDVETNEWLESLDYVIANSSPERVRKLLHSLKNRAAGSGISLPFLSNTRYVNT
ncbi:MAG: hypothetical protein JRC77_10210, partial [Deltaproteobacteria bacterium]|nr:hypothetical protein [Deltaproteobacteria bacterium]